MSSVPHGHRAGHVAAAQESVHVLACFRKKASRCETEQLLSECSYEVTTTNTTREALEILKKSLAGESGRVHLVLKEHELPHVDARKLLRCMQECHPLISSIPVVVVSDQDDRETVLSCLQEGAADYLIKPLRVNELRNLWTRVYWKQIYEQTRASNEGRSILPSSSTQRGSGSAPDTIAEDSKDTKCDNDDEPTSKEGSAPDAERNGSDGHDGKAGNHNSGSGGNGDSGNNRNSGNYLVGAAGTAGVGDNGNNGTSTNKDEQVGKAVLEEEKVVSFAVDVSGVTQTGEGPSLQASNLGVLPSHLVAHRPSGGNSNNVNKGSGDGSGSLASSHGHAGTDTRPCRGKQEQFAPDSSTAHPVPSHHTVHRPKAQHLAGVPFAVQRASRSAFGAYNSRRTQLIHAEVPMAACPGDSLSPMAGTASKSAPLPQAKASLEQEAAAVAAAADMLMKGWRFDKVLPRELPPEATAAAAAASGVGGSMLAWPWNVPGLANPGGMPAGMSHSPSQQGMHNQLQQQWFPSAVPFGHPYAQMQLAAAIMQNHLQMQLPSQYSGPLDSSGNSAQGKLSDPLEQVGMMGAGGLIRQEHGLVQSGMAAERGFLRPPGTPAAPFTADAGMLLQPQGKALLGRAAAMSGEGALRVRPEVGLGMPQAPPPQVAAHAGGMGKEREPLVFDSQSRKQKVDKYREKKRKRKAQDVERRVIRYPKRMEIANRRPRRKGMFVSCKEMEMEGGDGMEDGNGAAELEQERGQEEGLCSPTERDAARRGRATQPSAHPGYVAAEAAGGTDPNDGACRGPGEAGGSGTDVDRCAASSKPPDEPHAAAPVRKPIHANRGLVLLQLAAADVGGQATGASASGSNESPDDNG